MIEGTLPPQFKLVGAAHSYTQRQTWLCQQAVLQSPHAKLEQREVTFQRLDKTRYRDEVDLAGLPSGGFCDWAIADVQLLVRDTRDKYRHAHAVSLVPTTGALAPVRAIPFAPKLELTCKRSRSGQNIDCRAAHTLITDLRHDVELQLDVSYEDVAWPLPAGMQTGE